MSPEATVVVALMGVVILVLVTVILDLRAALRESRRDLDLALQRMVDIEARTSDDLYALRHQKP